MNKPYFLLIAGLVLIAAGIGGYAFYRSTNQPAPMAPPSYQISPDRKTPVPAAPTDEAVDTSKNSIPLTISSPLSRAQITSPTVTITGATAPNADIAVADKDLTADSQGNFSTTITLEDGDNEILIVASNETGSAEESLSLTYTPSP